MASNNKCTSHLLQSVQRVCDQTKLSARLVQHSNGRVHAYDCPQWSNKTASLFRFQEPNAIVCVEQSVASLSGFVLVIEERRARHIGLRMFMAIASTCFVYLALWLLYSHINNPFAEAIVEWPFLSIISNIFNDNNITNYKINGNSVGNNESSCKK